MYDAENVEFKFSRLRRHLKCAGLKQDIIISWLKLIVRWDLKEHHIIIIIIKNHKGKFSVEFPESVDSEKSYFTR